MEVVLLGVTSLPDDVILNYLDSLKSIYSPEAYDLFMHNCNNFTNDVAQFLCGRSIPGHITSLPQTVLDTPFGQILKPMLDRALRPITTAPNLPSTAAPPTPRHPAPVPAQVIVADSLLRLEEALESAKSSCAVVFFTSATCGPCRAIYPRFSHLASDAGAKAKFIKVDVGVAYEAGRKYRISATPIFMTFLKGKKVEEWKGASEGDLIARVNALLLMAYPRKTSVIIISDLRTLI
jgi:thiol-disulfide isomerase/thioredoxin